MDQTYLLESRYLASHSQYTFSIASRTWRDSLTPSHTHHSWKLLQCLKTQLNKCNRHSFLEWGRLSAISTWRNHSTPSLVKPTKGGSRGVLSLWSRLVITHQSRLSFSKVGDILLAVVLSLKRRWDPILWLARTMDL